MANKKTSYMDEAEMSFAMSCKMIGIALNNEQLKTLFRLAVYCGEKKGDVSIKEVATIQRMVEEEKSKSEVN